MVMNRVTRSLGASHRALLTLVFLAAAWGIVVDAHIIPILAPTGNSTLFQATTAASFAVLGILFGPGIGALVGLVRDGTSSLTTLFMHPHAPAQIGYVQWIAFRAADILEDVVLGWVPGLVAQRTKRVTSLVLAAAVAAWLSLPALVTANTLIAGHPGGIWHALGTAVGDWDEPVDPGLTVYALWTGCFVALTLAPLSSRPRRSLVQAAACGVTAVAMVMAGAHA